MYMSEIGVTLGYAADSTTKPANLAAYTEVLGAFDIPALYAAANRVNTTTIKSKYTTSIFGKRSTDGFVVQFYRDAGASSNYATLKALTGVRWWALALPDGSMFEFKAAIDVTPNAIGIDTALAFTASFAMTENTVGDVIIETLPTT